MTEIAIQMVLALAFVIFLIFGLSFVYRKRGKGSKIISLAGYQAIGQKAGVAAVKVGGEILVLSVTPTEVRLLKQFPDTGEAGQEVQGIAEKVKRLRKMKEEI
ncbi:MAG: hypothetical protein HGA78_00130 [Nitrospirales bacterium]|nr:hypothetical protein [Nitrospirales bacterium]